MKYVLKDCMILDESSPHDGRKMDILVKNNDIIRIAKSIEEKDAKEITGESLHISPGWIDVGVTLGEPGHEPRETIASLCASAKVGGYTDIAVFPNAIPAIQTRAQITQLIQEGRKHKINIHPIGALSNDLEGIEITEIIDLKNAGAVAFSDGNKPVEKDGLLLRALQYVKSFDGLIIHHPKNNSLDHGGHVNEGEISISMGIKGSPTLSETLVLNRDIELASYAESKIAVHNISSKESVRRLKNTSKDSMIFASVPFINLIETQESVRSFDVNYKVDPPLRTIKDRSALIKAVNNGTIDYITSNHTPLEEEYKKLEFTYAEAGIIGLQTCFSVLNTYVADKIDLRTIINKISRGPKEMLGLKCSVVAEGSKGSFTVFDPEHRWTYSKDNKLSISSNTPYLNRELKGKVVRVIS